MTPAAERLASWPARRPRAALCLCALVTALAVWVIASPSAPGGGLRIDPSLDELLPRDDPGRVHYDDLRARFGRDDRIVLAVRWPDVFTPDSLAAIERLTARLEADPTVRQVTSLARAVDLASDGADLHLGGLLDPLPRDPESIRALREEVLGHPILAGQLVSRDGRVAVFAVELEPVPEDEFIARELDRRIEAIARAEIDDATIWLAGVPVVKAEMSRILVRDLVTLVPAVLLLMVVYSWRVFRGLAGALIPVGSVVLALLWTLGTMAWAGQPLDVVTSLVPPLILVIGFAYVMHVVSAQRREIARGRSPVQATRNALREVAGPVALTGLTTGVGFASLAVSPLAVIRDFAVFASIGVLLSLLSAWLLAAAGLALARAPRRAADEARSRSFDGAIRRLAHFDWRHRRGILVAAGLTAAVSLATASWIEVDTEIVENFEADAPIRRSMEAINRHLDGASTFSVTLSSPREGAFLEPATLAAVRELQDWLEAQPEIGGTTSLADHVSLLHRSLVGTPGLPDSRRVVAQLLLLGDDGGLSRWVDNPRSRAAIEVRSKVSSSRELSAVVDRTRERIAELPGDLDGEVTGNAVLLTRTADDISRGQVRSLAAALVVIFGILALTFRSLRLGAIALVPNVLPVVLYFGLLGASGVGLTNATALMGCIVLGIAVDDTLHLLVHYRRAARECGRAREALTSALLAVARPVSHTSAVLCLGLLLLGQSELASQADFGWLGAATLAAAWLVDLTVTPALCSWIDVRPGRETNLRRLPLALPGRPRPSRARIARSA
ncbi:MAG: efflux RND transporter permease subunit [Myxococcota bacterium]